MCCCIIGGFVVKLDKIKVGKKYRIKIQGTIKPYSVNALIVANNVKDQILNFEVYKRIFECKYDGILKIQFLWLYGVKILLEIIFLSAFVFSLYRFLEYQDCKKNYNKIFSFWCGCETAITYDEKPIIYLYPDKVTNVTVELGNPENITHAYPKYKETWHVEAKPNGDLKDLRTGRSYYALYWEGKNIVSVPNPVEGFVVKGKDTVEFLEEKLDRLGLNEREAAEFIIYWLPKLENAEYNLIRFQTLSEQNKNMPLNIMPKPETLIRVMMEYKNLEQSVQIKEQSLPEKPERNGFTVVEWGGTEI